MTDMKNGQVRFIGKPYAPTVEKELLEVGRRALPVVGLLAAALGHQARLTVRQLRGIASHPSPAARVGLAALMAVDAAGVGWTLGKQRGVRKNETPEQAKVRRETLAPLTPVRFAAMGTDAASVYLLAYPRVGRSRAALLALGAYGVGLGAVFTARALHPRMVAVSADLERLTAETKRDVETLESEKL